MLNPLLALDTFKRPESEVLALVTPERCKDASHTLSPSSTWKTGALALHFAVQASASPNVIKKIINAYPDALFRANIHLMTPKEYAEVHYPYPLMENEALIDLLSAAEKTHKARLAAIDKELVSGRAWRPPLSSLVAPPLSSLAAGKAFPFAGAFENNTLDDAADNDSPTGLPTNSGKFALSNRLLDTALEDGMMRGPLSGMFPASLPVPSFAAALDPICNQLPEVKPGSGRLAEMAWRKAGSILAQFPSLTRDECAAIVLYTMEEMPRERSPYYAMNAALREKNRQAAKPWRDFVWLLLHALRKLPPCKDRMVYRGMTASVLAEGAVEQQWSAFSSTATKLKVMEGFLNDASSGPCRTMIHLELTEQVGRDVSAFSLYPQECEVLLPPNVCFEVVSSYKAGNGLVMVQCKQTKSLDMLLDFT